MAGGSTLCPYVGLQPFTEADRAYFFGREREIRLVSANLYAAKLTVLYGASGVGKSSLLMAGVVPGLRKKPHTAVVMFREWQRPDAVALLKKAVARAADEAAGRPLGLDDGAPLDDLLAAAGQAIGGTTLLLLDQFEEYFLYFPRGGAGDVFDAELARAVNRRDVDAGFVLSIREDSLSKLDRFRGRITTVLANPLRINHLRPQDARDAIRKPLEVHNLRPEQAAAPVGIEDALVDALIEQTVTGSVSLSQAGAATDSAAKAGERVEAPYLQLVLMRLWDEETRAGSRVLRLATLDTLGGAQQIVRTHLDQVMARLPAAQQALCAAFFDRLVTPSGSKIACRLDDLQKWAGSGREAEVRAVVDALAAPQARILRAIDPLPGDPPQYEIFHDVLAAGVLDWRLRYVETQSREQAQAEAEAQRQETERERRRAERAHRTARQLKFFSVAVVGVSVMALGAAWWAYDNQKRATRATAESQEAKAESQEAKARATQEAEKRAVAEKMFDLVSQGMSLNMNSNPDATVEVPGVKGQSLGDAQARLKNAGLVSLAGEVAELVHSAPPGTVLEQFPPARLSVEKDDAVYLVVATTQQLLEQKKIEEAKAKQIADERARQLAEAARTAAAAAASAAAAVAAVSPGSRPAEGAGIANPNQIGSCPDDDWRGGWLASGPFQEQASREKREGRYPAHVQGRIEKGQLQFRAVFAPKPTQSGFAFTWDLFRSDADREALIKLRAGKNLKPRCQQWFVDGSGVRRWQIVWAN